ncbi:MarR family winged helix-turn-helix transcriptional regulator [Pseudonocardia asaccharolytica]|uniref:MarR family transcriptional regulator n=1 Tax=Pseudonocardia asaccharolytica DSM 44247 = NBRC 16224 TaxID=1123024 RepID=A0A511D972_9PSEU|nr:MarR family transcriptional regulator [Pseudonocardia asaccharolytica]GEL20194.1 MarR family transcriptional regulator [Pseudonocardia asaccharolytica DSM 44247 = NBRC 16224]
MSPGTVPLADAALGLLLHQVQHQMSRRIETVLRESTGAPTLDQWRVLELLADGAGHPMSEIAGYARVPAPTLTKIVDRLVGAALVYRRVDDADRRRVLVFLSEHGRRLHDRLAPEVTAAEQAVADELGTEQAAQLRGLLAQLADRLG